MYDRCVLEYFGCSHSTTSSTVDERRCKARQPLRRTSDRQYVRPDVRHDHRCQGIAACGLEFGASPAYSGAGPVMVGTALVMTGTAGGVVDVVTDPPELPDAAICGFCVNITAKAPSVTMAQDPATAAHILSFAVTLRLIFASKLECLIGASDLRCARLPS